MPPPVKMPGSKSPPPGVKTPPPPGVKTPPGSRSTSNLNASMTSGSFRPPPPAMNASLSGSKGAGFKAPPPVKLPPKTSPSNKSLSSTTNNSPSSNRSTTPTPSSGVAGAASTTSGFKPPPPSGPRPSTPPKTIPNNSSSSSRSASGALTAGTSSASALNTTASTSNNISGSATQPETNLNSSPSAGGSLSQQQQQQQQQSKPSNTSTSAVAPMNPSHLSTSTTHANSTTTSNIASANASASGSGSNVLPATSGSALGSSSSTSNINRASSPSPNYPAVGGPNLGASSTSASPSGVFSNKAPSVPKPPTHFSPSKSGKFVPGQKAPPVPKRAPTPSAGSPSGVYSTSPSGGQSLGAAHTPKQQSQLSQSSTSLIGTTTTSSSSGASPSTPRPSNTAAASSTASTAAPVTSSSSSTTQPPATSSSTTTTTTSTTASKPVTTSSTPTPAPLTSTTTSTSSAVTAPTTITPGNKIPSTSTNISPPRTSSSQKLQQQQSSVLSSTTTTTATTTATNAASINGHANLGKSFGSISGVSPGGKKPPPPRTRSGTMSPVMELGATGAISSDGISDNESSSSYATQRKQKQQQQQQEQGRLMSVSPSSSPISFAKQNANTIDNNNAMMATTSNTISGASPPRHVGASSAGVAMSNVVSPSATFSPQSQAAAGGQKPIKSPPPRKNPAELQPHHLGASKTGQKLTAGGVPITTALVPSSSSASSASPSRSTSAGLPPHVTHQPSLGATAATSSSPSSKVFAGITENAARLSVPVSTANVSGGANNNLIGMNTTSASMSNLGATSSPRPQARVAAQLTNRPVTLVISSDDDDDDNNNANDGASSLMMMKAADGSTVSSKAAANSLRRAVVTVRPANTSPSVPMWVQHVMNSSSDNSSLLLQQSQQQQQQQQQQNSLGALSPGPTRQSMMTSPVTRHMNPNTTTVDTLLNNSNVNNIIQSTNQVRSFVLHHYSKRTQGLLHDCFRLLVQTALKVDGAIAAQQQQPNVNSGIVMTYSSSICFVAMMLRLHDRRFAIQHALLLSFANNATGGISSEAHLPLMAVDVETWVNTLTAVLDNTRSSTCSFAAALLEEDLSVPNYVAHARAAGRHDAYLELTLPEILTRFRQLLETPWLRIVVACCAPEALLSLSQNHIRIAALFERFGSSPVVFSQQQGMMSPGQQQQQNTPHHSNKNDSSSGGAWSMTTPRSRVSSAVLPQDAFPVPHLLVSVQQIRKMLECSGTSDSVCIMPQILTVSGFKQIVELLSYDAPGVALNFGEFQMFLAVVADRACRFEDAPTSFDSGMTAPPQGTKSRPLSKAIAGKIHHLVEYLAA